MYHRDVIINWLDKSSYLGKSRHHKFPPTILKFDFNSSSALDGFIDLLVLRDGFGVVAVVVVVAVAAEGHEWSRRNDRNYPCRSENPGIAEVNKATNFNLQIEPRVRLKHARGKLMQISLRKILPFPHYSFILKFELLPNNFL